MNEKSEQLSENTSAKQSPDKLWTQLGHAVALAAKQDQIVWTVFGVFWAANAVLLVALFTTGDLPKRPAGLIVSIVGLAISVVWAAIQIRAIAWLNFYDEVMKKLEDLLQPPVRLTGRRDDVKGMSVRTLMRNWPFVSVVLWSGAVLWFLTHP